MLAHTFYTNFRCHLTVTLKANEPTNIININLILKVFLYKLNGRVLSLPMISPTSTCRVLHLSFFRKHIYLPITINSVQLRPQDFILLHRFSSCRVPSTLESQLLNAITCAQLALIFLRSLDHMGQGFSLSQGCNVTG